MADLSSAIPQFLSELQECGSLWHSVDVRVVAIRFFGRLSSLVTTCVLDPRTPDDVPRIAGCPETRHVLAFQHVIPFEELASFLEELSTGEINMDGRVISFRSGEALNERQSSIAEGQPYSWAHVGFLDRSSPWAQKDYLWSALTFSVNGDAISQYFRHLPREHRGIDQEIQTCSHPYDGLAGLVKQFARGSEQFGAGSSSAHFEIVAPFHVRFSREWSGFDEELRIGIRAGSASAENAFRIGYVTNELDGLPQSGTVDLAGRQIIEEAPDRTLLVTQQITTSGSATLFLNVGSLCVDKLTLTRLPAHGYNPRIEAIRTVDPELEYFRSGLNPTNRSAANSFEQSVGRLFAFLGFTVDVLGPDKRLSDGVDCFAFSDGMILAIECTTGSIDAGGKLGKLVARARTLEAALDGGVLAVLTTPLEKERIATQEMLRAGEDGVAVLTRAELDYLFSMSLANTPLSDVLAYIEAQVPPRRPEESLGQVLRRLR